MFLFILVAFPLIFSSSQQQQDVRQRAQATVPDNTPAGTYEIFGSAFVGDSLRGGWGAKTWYGGGNTVNLIVNNPVYDGVHSFSYYSTAPNDAMEIFTDTPFDISPYNYLSFYARADQPGLRFGLRLLGPRQPNNNFLPIGQMLTMDQYGGVPPTDRWFVYNFPLANFNAGTNQIYGIVFIDLNGGGLQKPIYFDEMQFGKNRATEGIPTQRIQPLGSPPPSATPIPPYFPEISPWVFIIPGFIILLAIFFE